MNAPRMRKRDRDTVIQALSAGVVPRSGIQHVQVGRANEIKAVIDDIERIRDEGSSFRLIIGEYGSGKTFFLTLAKLVALEKGLVVAGADLGPDRRLHATSGQARSLYAELMRGLATRTKPEGGALEGVVQKFASEALRRAEAEGTPLEELVHDRLAPLRELVTGHDFATAVIAYTRAYFEGDDRRRDAALRWLRAEYPTKTDARRDLQVSSIIDDAGVYDYLKLLARFVQIAGYEGLVVTVDELVNLYKLQSAQARKSNYEQILRMLNDTLQGGSARIGFLMGGTPELLMDTRRGLYSYDALQGRLVENRFATGGYIDMRGPVIRLSALTQEELLVLLEKIRHVFAMGDSEKHLVPDEAFHAFMRHCSEKLGEAYFRTPRTTIKSWVQLLSILEQNPQASWQELLGATEVEIDGPEPLGVADDVDDELARFKL